jgi:Na+-transporting methylmalonyl-CoA/oxaloacetate decarboxylase gamma subunit
MSSGKFFFLIMNYFFVFAFLTIVYFVKNVSTGIRRSPQIKGKSPERDEIGGRGRVGVELWRFLI